MFNETKKIRELLRRFDSGETSLAEERRLFSYYATHRRLAQDLERRRREMAFYLEMECGSDATTEAKTGRRRNMLSGLSIAASVALLMTVGLSYLAHQQTIVEEQSLYDGSYVIRNGVRYTAIPEILPALKEAETMVEEHSKGFVSEEPDYTTLRQSGIDLDDPAVYEAVKTAFEE